MKKFITFVIISLFSLCAYCTSVYNVQNAESLKNSSLKIETDWDFYWGKFVPFSENTEPDLTVPVPSAWNSYALDEDAMKAAKKGKGSGTYRLKLTGLIPGKKYAVPTFELAYTAYTMLADDKIIFTSGVPCEDWEKTDASQYYDKAVFECGEDGSVTITMYVSNSFYRKGGLRHDFVLYEEPHYMEYCNKILCFYGIFSGILLAIIAYCFLLAFLKKDRANLCLSLFIFSIYTRIIASVFPLLKIVFKNFPLEMLFRIEYLSLFMAPALYALYMESLNRKIFNHFKASLVAAPAFILLILNFTLPISFSNRLVPVYQAYMFMMVGLILLLFLVRVIKNKDFTSITAIISLIIIALGTFNDFFIKNHIPLSLTKNTNMLVPCFVLYSFVQTVLMAFIQNKNQQRVIELNDNLTVTNNAYYRFVPKEFIHLLSKDDITELRLGEYKISKMAILSADIRNFTATSENVEGIQVFDMLNSYLGRIAPLIRKNGGVIEKYLGDGIIAIFPDGAENALNCAIQMQEEMIDLRSDFVRRGLPPIKIGIGIHYGNLVIGTGGDDERMTEISLSDDIDITVKTEATTKELKRPILATCQAVGAAAREARAEGRKFNFYGRKLYDSKGNILYALYTDKTGDAL